MLLSFSHCSHKERSAEDPEALYSEAEELFKDEKYLQAIDKYRDIKNRFPYHSRATDSELRIGDAYYAQEAYIEAESAYEIFKELHPTHSRSDYVQYRIALAYYNEIPDNSARDLSTANRAIDAFATFLDRYPNSEYAEKAREYSRESKKRLGEHEHYVAQFYYYRKHYLSASYRYAALLKDFGNLGYDEEALFRLGDCYFKIRMFANAKSTLGQLLEKYPDTSFKGATQSILEEINKKG